jgi:hypothetical protein
VFNDYHQNSPQRHREHRGGTEDKSNLYVS